MKTQTVEKMDFDTRLRGLRGILWDLDNTLYRLEEMLEDSFNVAIARAAIDQGIPLSFESAVAMARTSYEKTGYSGRYFLEQFGLDRNVLHFAFHKHLDEKVINASLELQQLMDSAKLTHALITHGARDWALRVLQHIGLRHHFPEPQVFALEDMAFEKKHESRRAFLSGLDALGVEPAEALVMEDLAENLVIPHQMGLGTVWLHHGRVPDTIPAHVDYCCANAVEFMQYYHSVVAR
ncbi:MAG: HAD hydrolase-like protein [Alphaproteobacteria bacterium]|nr:HAD hydrolase-like protein [Alphaproteobacteria bacterium]